jgi:manganese oxidase
LDNSVEDRQPVEQEFDLGTPSVSRRNFLEKALISAGVVSVGVIGASAGVAITSTSGKSVPAGRPAQAAHMTESTHAAHASQGVVSAAPQGALGWQEMDEHHRQGVEDFLKNQVTPITRGKGNQPLEPTIEGGVKVFHLSCDEVEWEVSPGRAVKARGYNGMLPGPIIRATQGDRVRIIVQNNLSESTAVHWHGLYVPNNMDGVPFVNQEPIRPGESFTYEFTLRNPGTHMGLLGAFIVDPADRASYPAHDREYIVVLNDLNLGFTINGKGFPATEAFVAKKGERIVFRWLNEGIMHHPMHLHGMAMQVFAKDGYPVNPPQYCDTLDVAPGNRYDALVEATEEGVWAFHCHVLNHAEGPDGMFGMVTALVVE